MKTNDAKRVSAYRAAHVETASPGKQVVMIYDRIIRHLNAAVAAFEDESPTRLEAIHGQIQSASEIILELFLALDVEDGGDIASGLADLYDFWLKHLSEANATKNVKAVREVLDMICEIRDAWEQAAQETAMQGGIR
jgi:flagellar protein FliS